MKNIIIVNGIVKHFGIRLEAHRGSGTVGLSHNVNTLGNIAAGKGHLIDLPVLVDLNLKPLGQGVDNRGANAVQSA